ncbi:MAG: hypothetical protein HZY74_08875 [Brevundimonas sp.]|nr:MAG: hypothetical protein HZY74_08875 [Brevundimonas sp.]
MLTLRARSFRRGRGPGPAGGEYTHGSALTALYLHGTGPDEPLAQIAGTRRWFLSDTQGSIIAETDTAGARVGNAITYDPMASRAAGPAPASATPARCA